MKKNSFFELSFQAWLQNLDNLEIKENAKSICPSQSSNSFSLSIDKISAKTYLIPFVKILIQNFEIVEQDSLQKNSFWSLQKNRNNPELPESASDLLSNKFSL